MGQPLKLHFSERISCPFQLQRNSMTERISITKHESVIKWDANSIVIVCIVLQVQNANAVSIVEIFQT